MSHSGSIFYGVILSFGLGVAVFTINPTAWPGLCLLLLIAFVLALLRYRMPNSFGAFLLLLLSLALVAFALAGLRVYLATWQMVDQELESYLGHEIALQGIVVREPDERETSTHLYVRVGQQTILVKADPYRQYSYGDLLQIHGRLEKPKAFETDFGRIFNYPGYLLAKGVSYMINQADVSVISVGHGFWLTEKLLFLKKEFMLVLEYILPEPQAGLGEGVLLGVKRALGENLEELFRRTGIIHIVVLSGYNVMLVVKFITTILAVFFSKRGQVIFSLGAITCFAILVGLSATVVRASLMASFLLLAEVTGRIYLVTRALLLAGVIMLMINPYLLIYDIGFQLSFLATLGLIWLMPTISDRLTFIPNFAHVRDFFSATLSAQLAVLPVLLYQIGQFSTVAVVVNVLVLPVVPLAMLLTFITGAVGLFSIELALPLAFLAHLSLSYIINLSSWFGSLDVAAFVVPKFSLWWVGIGYALLVYFWYRLNRHELNPLHGWQIEEDKY